MAVELLAHPLFSDANLVAYYRLENVNDSKGSYTLTNNNSVGFSTGVFSNAADFTSANSNKNLRNLSNLTINGGVVTVMGWLNLYSIQAFAFPFYLSSAASKVAYAWKIESGGIKFVRNRLNVQEDQTSVVTLSSGAWYHVALTYDGTNLIGYVNGAGGTPVAVSGNGAGTVPDVFVLGAGDNGSGTTSFFCNCLLDDVTVFNRALSAAEIAAYYSATAGNAFFLAGD